MRGHYLGKMCYYTVPRTIEYLGAYETNIWNFQNCSEVGIGGAEWRNRAAPLGVQARSSSSEVPLITDSIGKATRYSHIIVIVEVF